MIHLLVTSGRGPAECRLAVARVVELFTAEAEAQGLDVSVVEGPPHAEGNGPGSVVVALDGEGEAALCRSWVGTIQWRAASSLRPGHKRKNWFVSVSELPPRPPPGAIDVKDVRFETFRAGGPGGQHQNVTDSAVRATHVPTGLTVVVREGRSQHQNKATAVARLRQLVEIRADIARGALRDEAQKRHDGLERGNPVRVV